MEISTARSLVAAVVLLSLPASAAVDAKRRVLSEASKELGSGFREVTRSVENPPGSFEGVGHFRFLYFREQELGQHGTSPSPQADDTRSIKMDRRATSFSSQPPLGGHVSSRSTQARSSPSSSGVKGRRK